MPSNGDGRATSDNAHTKQACDIPAAAVMRDAAPAQREGQAACIAVRVPENGYLSDPEYESGRKGNRGYRPVDETCVAVSMPKNAYLKDSEYERGWKCERGYEDSDCACVELKLPENSHLDYSGSGWECDKPYRKRQDGCVLV